MRRLVLGVVLLLVSDLTALSDTQIADAELEAKIEKLLPPDSSPVAQTKQPQSYEEPSSRTYPDGIPGNVIAALMKAWPKDWVVENTTARFPDTTTVELEHLNGAKVILKLDEGSGKGMIPGLTVEGRSLSMIFRAVPEFTRKRADYGISVYFVQAYDFGFMRGVVFYDLNVFEREGMGGLGDPGDIPGLQVNFSRDGKRIVSSGQPV